MQTNSFGSSYVVTKAIKILLIVNIVVFIFQILPYPGNRLIQWGGLVPLETFGGLQLWRLFTYMFLHDVAPFHILFNMLMLWMFGTEIENLWGTRRFTIFYLICGAGSGCFSIFHLFNATLSSVPVIGASGAVLGVMTAYAYYFPHRQVLLFFIIPVNIRVVIIGAALISFVFSLNQNGIVAHLTHLGGILVAIGYVKLYPIILKWFESYSKAQNETQSRKRIEKEVSDSKFFEEQIDPILAKISREGMGSLSKQEKELLKKAASRNKDKLKNGKIVPLDPFR